jgi:lipoprotein-releasing system permease protein
MYTLLLCLKYLFKRRMAYLAMAVVALVVFMLVIAVSVMNGFLWKVEDAAKGLFGDIVIEADQGGIGYYDEFIAEITPGPDGSGGVEGVQAAAPFILSMGVLQVDGVRELVQIAGVRLPQAADVTDFEGGLHFQGSRDRPTFDPPIDLLIEGLEAEIEKLRNQYAQLQSEAQADEFTIEKYEIAIIRQQNALSRLRNARQYVDELNRVAAALDEAYRQSDGAETVETIELGEQLEDLQIASGYMPRDFHLILGAGIRSLIGRTSDGETIRMVVPGDKVTLLVAPLGEQLSMTDVSPNRGVFTVIDDNRSDVHSIDSSFVYVPFETLQRLNNMGARYAPPPEGQGGRGPMVRPARANQIQVKVTEGLADDELALRDVARRIRQKWVEFSRTRNTGAAASALSVQTWRERQRAVIEPIESQRTLVAIMWGTMYLVCVCIVVAILYTIVMHKTRDIGVLKAIGASSWSVTQLFLMYSAAIAAVGAVLGVILGWLMVRNINPIHDWAAQSMGLEIWSAESFLFEHIPNQVDWFSVVWIVAGAVLSCLAGASVPALLAARMQPVRALRYE